MLSRTEKKMAEGIFEVMHERMPEGLVTDHDVTEDLDAVEKGALALFMCDGDLETQKKYVLAVSAAFAEAIAGNREAFGECMEFLYNQLIEDRLGVCGFVRGRKNGIVTVETPAGMAHIGEEYLVVSHKINSETCKQKSGKACFN